MYDGTICPTIECAGDRDELLAGIAMQRLVAEATAWASEQIAAGKATFAMYAEMVQEHVKNALAKVSLGKMLRDTAIWKITWSVLKWWDSDKYDRGEKHDEELIVPKNLLMYGGTSVLWECLIGNGTATAGQNLTYFNNAQAGIGIGDSTTAAVATQTDLQASVNKLRVGMNGGYPSHTDGTTSGAATITWQSTFGASQGNYTWNEAGVFNSTTAATGRMLNRLVQALGQKLSPGVWSVGAQISLS